MQCKVIVYARGTTPISMFFFLFFLNFVASRLEATKLIQIDPSNDQTNITVIEFLTLYIFDSFRFDYNFFYAFLWGWINQFCKYITFMYRFYSTFSITRLDCIRKCNFALKFINNLYYSCTYSIIHIRRTRISLSIVYILCIGIAHLIHERTNIENCKYGV